MPVPWGPRVLHLQEPGAACQLPQGRRQHLPLQRRAQEAAATALRCQRLGAGRGSLDAEGERIRPARREGKEVWGLALGEHPRCSWGFWGERGAWLRFDPIVAHLPPSPWGSCSRQCQ